METDSRPPQFIFGPLGNGYRLRPSQRRIAQALGLLFLVPGIVLVVLAQMKMVAWWHGIGAFALSLVLTFVAMKIYVAAAKVPVVTRRETEDA